MRNVRYKLITAEKELLAKTLKGSINTLTEVLALVNPEAFGRSSRIKRHIVDIMERLDTKDTWEIETAALLCQIGCVVIPETALKKIYFGEELDDEESQLYNMHPMVGYDLLNHIPRMQGVAGIIRFQEKHFDGTGIPLGPSKEKDLPLGSRILKLVLDYDTLETRGLSSSDAIGEMRNRTGTYDPELLEVLVTVLRMKERFRSRTITLRDLRPGMILKKDITSQDGVLLLSRGVQINILIMQRLLAYTRNSKINDDISVFTLKGETT